MKFESIGQILAVFCIVLTLVATSATPVQAAEEQNVTKVAEIPADGHPQTTIERDSVFQSFAAVMKNDRGVARVAIIKDPTSPLVTNGRVAAEKWTEVTELGHSPWGSPAKSIQEIAADSNVRAYIKTKTTLEPEQQAALQKGLDSPDKWMTVKASELPILEAFWGRDWQRYKVSMNLSKKFKDTQVFLYFAEETGDWFAFYAYCRNLGQPFSGFSWTAKVEEHITPPEPPKEVKPKVVMPKCISLTPKDGQTGPILGTEQRTYAVTFDNPSGLDVSVSYVLRDKKTHQVRPLSSGQPEITITAKWLSPGAYTLVTEAKANGQKVDTSACSLDFAVALPPAAPPKEVVEKKSNHMALWLVLAGAAAAVVVVVATKGGGPKGTKTQPGVYSPAFQIGTFR